MERPDTSPPQRAGAAMLPLLLAAATVALIALLVARLSDPAAPATAAAEPVEVRVGRIGARAERLRAVPLQGRLRVESIDRDRLRSLVERISERDDEPSHDAGVDDALHLMGVIPAGRRLSDVVEDGLTAQVAGVYDQVTDRLYLVESDRLAASESTVLHEIVHAIQDQRYDLDALLRRSGPRDADARAAAVAVAEGDATEVQSRDIRGRGFGAALEELGTAVGQTAGSGGGPLPPYLQRGLEFPYVVGAEFAGAVRDAQGEAGIDRAFRDPPRTTLAIMRPERWLDGRDDPVPVASPAPAPGARRVLDTTFGAADVQALTGDRDVAETWRGGRILVDRRGAEGTLTIVIASVRPAALAGALRRNLPAGTEVAVAGPTVTARRTAGLVAP